MEIRLPDKFMERIKEDLGDEAEAFLESYHDEPRKGLRINPLKTDEDKEGLIAAGLKRVPWESHGYYYNIERDFTDDAVCRQSLITTSPGKSPLHAAGAYYIQEPSAMAPVSFLDVRPGMCVLDLCAAPGGKSTQIAAYLKGRGLLVSNEIITERARILSQNIERMGISDALVVSHDPKELAERFPAAFDRILVDAPCSGEGMFRKDPASADEWSSENVSMCAKRQEEILDLAAIMLKPGGKLIYSTCTFSRAEDEGQADSFLRRHKDYHPAKLEPVAGMRRGVRSPGSNTVRILPQDGFGEGHFVAAFEREGRLDDGSYGFHGAAESALSNKERQEIGPYHNFISDVINDGRLKERLSDPSSLFMFGKKLCAMPQAGLPALCGLKVIRAGLELGEIKKDRFVPSHSLAMAMRPADSIRPVELSPGSLDVMKYLNGQSINVMDNNRSPAADHTGWTLVTVSGISLGWAKSSDNMLKNHYPKGLRVNMA